MKNLLYIAKKYLTSTIKGCSYSFIILCVYFSISVLFLSGCNTNDSNLITDSSSTSYVSENTCANTTDNITDNTTSSINDTTANYVDNTTVATDNATNITTNYFDNTTAATDNTTNITTNNVGSTDKTTEPSNTNTTEASTTKYISISSEETTTPVSDNNTPTLLSFLKNAIMPMGTTMYIWGGGWNQADTGAGIEAMTFGLSPVWINFYNSQNSSYNHALHRYEIHNGLDCSGYVGWVLYNTFGNKYSNTGYVYKSSTITSRLSDMGLGSYHNAGTYDFKPGDICSMAKHVWICLGTCSDGSALVLHSSPPGVRLCGTLLSDGSISEAVILAQETMRKYYPDWYSKYPNCVSNYSFITTSSRLRWSENVLKDPDGLRTLNAYQIIDYLMK